MGKEGPKDRLEMVSREPTWAKKVRKERLEMISREPTWAKEVPRIDKRANLGKEFCKDRLGKEGR